MELKPQVMEQPYVFLHFSNDSRNYLYLMMLVINIKPGGGLYLQQRQIAQKSVSVIRTCIVSDD